VEEPATCLVAEPATYAVSAERNSTLIVPLPVELLPVELLTVELLRVVDILAARPGHAPSRLPAVADPVTEPSPAARI
jgi:hypothetical protein